MWNYLDMSKCIVWWISVYVEGYATRVWMEYIELSMYKCHINLINVTRVNILLLLWESIKHIIIEGLFCCCRCWIECGVKVFNQFVSASSLGTPKTILIFAIYSFVYHSMVNRLFRYTYSLFHIDLLHLLRWFNSAKLCVHLLSGDWKTLLIMLLSMTLDYLSHTTLK